MLLCLLLASLQSSGLLQSGLGIDPAIYHHFVGPDTDRVYDTEHYVLHFLGVRTGFIARRRNSAQVNMFFRCDSSERPLPFLLFSLIGNS